MGAPYGNLRSKLSRALAAYLVGLNGLAGTAADIFSIESRADRGYPNTTCRGFQAQPEVPFTGNETVTVRISIKGSATLTDAQDAVNPKNQNAPRLTFDARVAATSDALMQSDDNSVSLKAMIPLINNAAYALAAADPANNADLADFTLLSWYDKGNADGEADAEGCSWEELLVFEAVCCPSAVDLS